MLDIILKFIATFLKKTFTTNSLSPAVGTGSVYVMQFGKVVLVSGQIDVSQAFEHGDILIRGLPPAKVPNPIIPLSDSNAGWDTAQAYGYLNNQANVGILRTHGKIQQSSHSFRISFTYIAA